MVVRAAMVVVLALALAACGLGEGATGGALIALDEDWNEGWQLDSPAPNLGMAGPLPGGGVVVRLGDGSLRTLSARSRACRRIPGPR